jgi:hypothetical protein
MTRNLYFTRNEYINGRSGYCGYASCVPQPYWNNNNIGVSGVYGYCGYASCDPYPYLSTNFINEKHAWTGGQKIEPKRIYSDLDPYGEENWED